MHKPLCNHEFDVRKGDGCEPHGIDSFIASYMHAMASGNEFVEFCLQFLVGDLVVDLF